MIITPHTLLISFQTFRHILFEQSYFKFFIDYRGLRCMFACPEREGNMMQLGETRNGVFT